MIVRDNHWLLPGNSDAKSRDIVKHQIERLEKIQKYLGNMVIETDEGTFLPVGVVNLASRYPTANTAVNTTVSVRLGQDKDGDQAEFCTKLANLSSKEHWKGLVDGLNRNADGKFVALDSDNFVTILLTSQKPVDWIDSNKLAREIEYHAETTLLFQSLLSSKTQDNMEEQKVKQLPSVEISHQQPPIFASRANIETKQMQNTASLKRLKQFQHFVPDMEIVDEEVVSGAFGIVDSDILTGAGPRSARVTVKVTRMRNNAQEQAEFSTKLGTVPSPDLALSCVHSLNRIMDGKFIAEEGTRPSSRDIVFVSAKPATWMDKDKIERELQTHSTAKATLEPLLARISSESLKWAPGTDGGNEEFTQTLLTYIGSLDAIFDENERG